MDLNGDGRVGGSGHGNKGNHAGQNHDGVSGAHKGGSGGGNSTIFYP